MGQERQSLEKSNQLTATGASSDPNMVDWEGPEDPHNPKNWSRWRISTMITLVNVIVFITSLASSMIAPGVPQLMEEFGSSNAQVATLIVSIELLGFALAPLAFAPLSELKGRNIIYHAANIVFVASSVACALAPSLGFLLVFRFIQGCAAACPNTIGGGTIADVVKTERRGAAMSFFTAGRALAPVVGPIVGGYVAEDLGWRWVFWLLTIFSGVISICAIPILKETYEPYLLQRKAAKLRNSTGNDLLQPKASKKASARMVFWRAITRPSKMFFLSPVIFGLSVYIGVVFGYSYLLFATFAEIFQQQYAFSEGEVGLVYLGLFIGMMVALGLTSIVSDRVYAKYTKKHERPKPEFRLTIMIYGAITIPIGLFVYGWTIDRKVHWIIPILATSLVGFGTIFTFIPNQVYLIDAYETYAASAIAANSVVRSLGGAFLPLAGIPMYRALGLGWGNSLLGFIAIALGGFPSIFYRYGERLRARFDPNFS